jgi:hypothetical protein
LRSAFHSSWSAPEPCRDGLHQDNISRIFEWLDESTEKQDHPMVFMLIGDDRSETSAIAQSVAMRAHGETRLLSSFFFAWSGKQEDRDSENLIPTVLYKLAQYNADVLHKVTESIIANPDVRDEGASTQINLLLKRLLVDLAALSSSDSPLLIVIDALDTCNDLANPQIAAGIGLFIQILASMTLRIKVLLTGRFPRAISHVVGNQAFPTRCQLVLPHYLVKDRTRTVPTAAQSDSDTGMLKLHLRLNIMELIWLRIVPFPQAGPPCTMELTSITIRLP